MTQVHGFVCGPRVYEYKGIEIEFPAMCGPYPLTKQGDPKQRWTKREHELVDEFLDLSDEERAKLRIGGGCQAF